MCLLIKTTVGKNVKENNLIYIAVDYFSALAFRDTFVKGTTDKPAQPGSQLDTKTSP